MRNGNFRYSGWIEDKEGEAIKKLNLNLEAITGLATAKAYSEALQVKHYKYNLTLIKVDSFNRATPQMLDSTSVTRRNRHNARHLGSSDSISSEPP